MTTENLTIANEIISQLGNKAMAMMGAKSPMAIAKGLQLDVGTNGKKVTRLWIVLDPSDTYTVTAYKGRGVHTKLVTTLSDVYVDSLHSVIESMTGLYLSL